MSTAPEPEMSVSWPQALAWRMGRHLLEPVGTASVADVVRRLGAVLALDGALAELAVRSRRADSRSGELAAAWHAGEVVKTFAFRGSMHHLSPADGGTYLALRAAGRQWELPSWVEHYRLRPEDWPDFRAAVREALSAGPSTVAELGETLAADRRYRHLGPTFAAGAGTLVKPLCWQGDVSLGPPRYGATTLQRLDTNPRWAGIPGLDEAGPRAVLAYLRTYGPATPEHVQHWLGDGLSAGRKRLSGWLAGLGDRLVAVDVDGTTALVAREDADPLAAASPSEVVRFLPGHDQWVIGPGTRDPHVTPPARRDLMTRKANPVVHGGVVRGTWTARGDDLVVTWLDERPAPGEDVVREADRLAGLLGRDLRLTVTPAT
ncbi:DNA glycosylase AlkZ-like family protein [Nocardioides dongxiaopingii]|uniref:DNA glycosylase AlkZ-like family protein n=1 Tax=Nocardioides dongxiaopingii TaxID=2576036 RepID=UPI001FE32C24|nr:crosslink repair DNA glycosylase YcaQ family protein [Nocardioides dongxiaopingii]